eukprot:586953-Pelagomonas_calceolata.AAC.3
MDGCVHVLLVLTHLKPPEMEAIKGLGGDVVIHKDINNQNSRCGSKRSGSRRDQSRGFDVPTQTDRVILKLRSAPTRVSSEVSEVKWVQRNVRSEASAVAVKYEVGKYSR